MTKSLGGKAYIAPLEVYLDDENIPQPDVMYLTPNSRCVVGKKRLEGPPELIVEVFSPGTAHHDKKRKFELYQKYAVQEYWMIDPTERYIDVFRYIENRFDFYGSFIPGDTFTSPVLNNQEVNVSELFGE